MAMLIDYHIHNHFSPDSNDHTREIAERALELGIEEIAITNHMQTEDPEKHIDIFSLEEAIPRLNAAKKEIEETQLHFPQLRILFGIEVDSNLPWKKDADLLVRQLDLDIALGSVHIVDDVIISSPRRAIEFYQHVSEEHAYSRYFELMQDFTRDGNFDVVAHFDVCKRGGTEIYGAFNPQKYKPLILSSLQNIKNRGLGIELNTGSMHRRCNEIYPHPDIIKWALEIGVEHFTLGSDSHHPDVIGCNFQEAIQIAKELGITKFTRYQKRNPISLP